MAKGDTRFSITLTEEQKIAKGLILEKPYSFILGEPGSGKTLLAIQIALDLFLKGDYKKVIISRPTVSMERNGFLPGDIKDKMEPWLVPIISNMYKIHKADAVDKLVQNGDIEIIALTHFRGRHFDKAVCIIDEFQNLTVDQLAMCMGRLGKESIMMFCGDGNQIDFREKEYSAFSKVNILEESQYVNKIVLEDNHRHPALKEVLKLLYK